MKFSLILIALILSGCSASNYQDNVSKFAKCAGTEVYDEGHALGMDVAGKSHTFERIFWTDGTKAYEYMDKSWDKCSRICLSSVSDGILTLKTHYDANNYDITHTSEDETIDLNLKSGVITGDTHHTADYTDTSIAGSDVRYHTSGTCQISEQNPTKVQVPHE